MNKIYLPDFKNRHVIVKAGKTAKEIYSQDSWFKVNELCSDSIDTEKLSFCVDNVELLKFDLKMVEELLEVNKLVDFNTCKSHFESEYGHINPINKTDVFYPNDLRIGLFFEFTNTFESLPVIIRVNSQFDTIEYLETLEVQDPEGNVISYMHFNPYNLPQKGTYTISILHIDGSLIASKNILIMDEELEADLNRAM